MLSEKTLDSPLRPRALLTTSIYVFMIDHMVVDVVLTFATLHTSRLEVLIDRADSSSNDRSRGVRQPFETFACPTRRSTQRATRITTPVSPH